MRDDATPGGPGWSCWGCVYWREDAQQEKDELYKMGVCRRRSPTTLGFVRTPDNEWCGEYKQWQPPKT